MATRCADTIGALGNPVIRTPQLDRLVREGTAFTRCHSPSPVCVPARCSLHYGRYPQRTRCYDNARWCADDGSSYPDRLGRAGYRTHAIGKCHFAPDYMEGRRGFGSREVQEEIVGDPEQDDYLRHLRNAGFDHVTDPHGARGEMYYVPQIAQMPARLHPTQWVGDRAVAFIDEQNVAGDPWCLKASFIHPHPPFAPPTPWDKLYRWPDMPLPMVPAQHESHWTHANRTQNRYKYRDQGIDLHLVRGMKAAYYACISFIDFQIGRILAALERSGQLDDTLIVFTSDHGEYLGDYHCFGKRSMHDASSRVPLLVRWPERFAAGAIHDHPVSLVDLAPTFCAAAGTTAEDMDGLPLDALVADPARRDAVFAQRGKGPHGEYMIVTRDWKYFYSAPDEEEYVYHLAHDPRETRRAADVLHRAKTRELRRRLLERLRDSGESDAYEEVDGQLRWRRYERLSPPRNPDDGLIIQDHQWAVATIPGYSRCD